MPQWCVQDRYSKPIFFTLDFSSPRPQKKKKAKVNAKAGDLKEANNVSH